MNLYNQIIKHERNLDVAYLVNKFYDVGHKMKLKVMVVNQGYVTTIPLNVNLNIEIKKEDYWKWHMCKEPHQKCIRYAEWKRII